MTAGSAGGMLAGVTPGGTTAHVGPAAGPTRPQAGRVGGALGLDVLSTRAIVWRAMKGLFRTRYLHTAGSFNDHQP